MQVRLERRDLGVLLQDGVRVQLLIGLVRVDGDVHAISEGAAL